MLISYVLDCGRGGHGMDDLSLRHLGHTCIPFEKVLELAPGKKADKIVRAGADREGGRVCGGRRRRHAAALASAQAAAHRGAFVDRLRNARNVRWCR